MYTLYNLYCISYTCNKVISPHKKLIEYDMSPIGKKFVGTDLRSIICGFYSFHSFVYKLNTNSEIRHYSI